MFRIFAGHDHVATAIMGTPLTEVCDLARSVAALYPDRKVTVTVWKNVPIYNCTADGEGGIYDDRLRHHARDKAFLPEDYHVPTTV